tara:strand:- start:27 stop:524 length:498 start_codon:yes stop_codon:yes gene_type:complete
MDDGAACTHRMSLGADAFSSEASLRSCHLFGPLTIVSPRAVWPVISQHAARMSSERLALIAEAAHVVPPIGAQGLNMSLQDVETLLDLAQADPQNLGSQTMLDAYQKARHADVLLRVRGIDVLNRASQAAAPVARDVRAAGLNTLYAAAPVRKMLMQMGLGMRRD